jgi:ParB-like chromosome segregation protein Spo0J
MKLERHPLSKLWPDIPQAQFLELKEDIQKHGQVYPITVYDKQIIDGWHRYRACSELEIKPQTSTFRGTPEQAADLVNSLNAHRRNVADGIRAFAVTGAYTWAEGCAKRGGTGAPLAVDTKTNSQMAVIAGTSKTTVKQAKRIHQEGSKPLKEAVKAGEVSVKKAAAVVDLPKSEQLAAAIKKPEKPRAVAETDFMPEPEPLSADEIAEMDEEVEQIRAEFAEKIVGADDRLVAADVEIQGFARKLADMTRHRDHWMNQAGSNAQFAKKLQGIIRKKDQEIETLRGRAA